MRLARTASDIALGGILVVLLGFSAYQLAVAWGAAYWVLDAVAGAVVGVIALLRRRDRWYAAITGITLGAVTVVSAWLADLPTEPGPAMALALSVLVGSGVARLPGTQAITITVGGLLVAAGSLLISQTSGVATMNAIGWVVAASVGTWLRLRAVRRHAIATRIRRDERVDLARELHDVVAHHIAGIVLQAQGARIAGRRQPAQYDESLAGIESAGAEALAAMRRVVGLLRDGDAMPGPAGLVQIKELVERFNGPTPELHLPDSEPEWPQEVTTTVCRIVQESLTNVARHAPHAGAVTVNVIQAGRSVTVDVLDDAEAGPVRYRRGGFGLVGIRERVEALGGTLTVGPRAVKGWAVSASLPLGPAR
ncbi:sensor histidine kinase [Kribbella albertanoniae]|uniref:histidine kinase n=1 Tax=Kribbella albertanoniae TaxID=1266829 RepID=A0A4R4PTR9_9ACTN|nr:histidine kinase [Kribbella albertanoniae]TDC25790.1 sensor histidine kinase [Kribbella albertanoniae]